MGADDLTVQLRNTLGFHDLAHATAGVRTWPCPCFRDGHEGGNPNDKEARYNVLKRAARHHHIARLAGRANTNFLDLHMGSSTRPSRQRVEGCVERNSRKSKSPERSGLFVCSRSLSA